MAFEPTRIKVSELVGRVVAPATVSRVNDKVWELRLAVGHGFKDKTTDKYRETGTTWVTYTAAGDYADALREAEQGDEIKVTGDIRLETRNWDKEDGTKGAIVTASYGDFEIIEKYVAKETVGASSNSSGW